MQPAQPLPINASPDLAALEAAFERPAVAAPVAGTGEPAFTEPAAHRLSAADGRPLAARWYEPRQPARAVALVNAATGVPQRYYRHFAAWLAARGYAVLSYDYRGIGESRQGPLRGETSRMRDWALLDMPAALAEAERRRSGARRLPLLVIGHSFGGNAVGLADGFERADALLGVAAQSGDWRNWPLPERALTHLFFHALVPLAARLFGHVPGWVLGGSGAGLPKGVALEWASWGRRRSYLFGDATLAAHLPGYRRFTGTAHLWNISDDRAYGPAAAVDALAAQFPAARVERPTLDAAGHGAGAIGHFGAFRPAAGALIWPLWLDRIEAATPALAASFSR